MTRHLSFVLCFVMLAGLTACSRPAPSVNDLPDSPASSSSTGAVPGAVAAGPTQPATSSGPTFAVDTIVPDTLDPARRKALVDHVMAVEMMQERKYLQEKSQGQKRVIRPTRITAEQAPKALKVPNPQDFLAESSHGAPVNVRADIVVDTDGSVVSVRVLDSSGRNDALVDAVVKMWRYSLYRPVAQPVIFEQTYSFASK